MVPFSVVVPSVAWMLKETEPAVAGESARTWKLRELPTATAAVVGVTVMPAGTEAVTRDTVTVPWKLPTEPTETLTLDSELELMLTLVWKDGTDKSKLAGPITKKTVPLPLLWLQFAGAEALPVMPKTAVAGAAEVVTVPTPGVLMVAVGVKLAPTPEGGVEIKDRSTVNGKPLHWTLGGVVVRTRSKVCESVGCNTMGFAALAPLLKVMLKSARRSSCSG